MSQKSLAQWLGNLLSATALALPYVASLVNFNSERSKSVQSKMKAVANARDLMDNAARVRTLEYDAAIDSLSNERALA